jgi:hypothetical protein
MVVALDIVAIGSYLKVDSDTKMTGLIRYEEPIKLEQAAELVTDPLTVADHFRMQGSAVIKGALIFQGIPMEKNVCPSAYYSVWSWIANAVSVLRATSVH